MILARTQNEEEKQRNLWILFAHKVLVWTRSFPFSTSGHPDPNSCKPQMIKNQAWTCLVMICIKFFIIISNFSFSSFTLAGMADPALLLAK